MYDFEDDFDTVEEAMAYFVVVHHPAYRDNGEYSSIYKKATYKQGQTYGGIDNIDLYDTHERKAVECFEQRIKAIPPAWSDQLNESEL